MKYSILLIVSGFTSMLVVLLILFSVSPFNPIRAKMDFNRQVYTFIPQGWAFFTRDPREAQVQLYQQNAEKKWVRVNHRHAHSFNIFGLSRKTTALITELQYIKVNFLKDNDFVTCQSSYQRGKVGCIPDTTIQIRNLFKTPILCGEYILTLQEPIPWAWANSIESVMMPSKVVRLNIECK